MKRIELDVDKVIERLLSVRSARVGTEVKLKEDDIRMLTILARDIFISQPIGVEGEAPVKICGRYPD